jgi:hypothetical protein
MAEKKPAGRRAKLGRCVRVSSCFGQMMCVSINKTTTTSGTPSNHRIIGISASRLRSGGIAWLNNACSALKFRKWWVVRGVLQHLWVRTDGGRPANMIRSCPTARAIAVGCARTIWRPCAMGRLPRDDGAELSNLRNERRRRDSIRRFECRAALTIVRPTTAGSCEYGKGGPAYPRSLPPSATRSLNFKNVRHSALFLGVMRRHETKPKDPMCVCSRSSPAKGLGHGTLSAVVAAWNTNSNSAFDLAFRRSPLRP